MKAKPFAVLMAVLIGLLILIATLTSCGTVKQYQVNQVNGQKFKVAGHRGTFISKDSITIGQWVPVKN